MIFLQEIKTGILSTGITGVCIGFVGGTLVINLEPIKWIPAIICLCVIMVEHMSNVNLISRVFQMVDNIIKKIE